MAWSLKFSFDSVLEKKIKRRKTCRAAQQPWWRQAQGKPGWATSLVEHHDDDDHDYHDDDDDDDDDDLYIIGAVCLSVTKVIISELSA